MYARMPLVRQEAKFQISLENQVTLALLKLDSIDEHTNDAMSCEKMTVGVVFFEIKLMLGIYFPFFFFIGNCK